MQRGRTWPDSPLRFQRATVAGILLFLGIFSLALVALDGNPSARIVAVLVFAPAWVVISAGLIRRARTRTDDPEQSWAWPWVALFVVPILVSLTPLMGDGEQFARLAGEHFLWLCAAFLALAYATYLLVISVQGDVSFAEISSVAIKVFLPLWIAAICIVAASWLVAGDLSSAYIGKVVAVAALIPSVLLVILHVRSE
ncbi:hypothetical protein IEU95_04560 [Hoyosella rhizosphaerae]|uniref:hypothetical protein n=1 Tax=Hoyosella rhizosphaerae TaxID=1755582 RepID=UPI001662AEEC|nr:hypothetical protein [Hoyosella rhizosphaerae]MBN4926088.1 hypothetical protein [Hoyosella rhizosphaerae]